MSSSSGGDNGIFRRFLNTTNADSKYTIVTATNPLQWGKLAQTVVSSLVAGFALGIQYTLGGLVDAVVGIFDGLTQFVYQPPVAGGRGVYEPADGIVPTVRRGLADAVNAALTAPQGLGWLTWPVYVLELLAAMYIVVWSVSYAREEVL